ncbi:hypothetical protein SAMN04488093_101318 [Tropicibacter naphthalenivorans]|uniref:Uncharacterized protein n=1 Tax=Tropicibacter naphthalenivorans TaxID=441103 RepID=A0A0P1G1I9_9RHOB|nr:hypothetical protein TRN7648_00561 [Tropicibacter naphthalenivorans]SMC42850.1 hypothetical protein SAMN04488093_101318 [Tropicibacter naphthalenivorans]
MEGALPPAPLGLPRDILKEKKGEACACPVRMLALSVGLGVEMRLG